MVSLDNKRVKVLTMVLILCVVLSGLLIGAAQLFQTQTEKPLYNADKKITNGEVEVVTEDSESIAYIPGTATSVYTVAPQSAEDVQKWWKSFTLISKYRLDMPVDIAPIADNIKQMTLVQVPDEDTFKENVGVLLEVKEDKDVTATRDYLATLAPEPNGLVAFQYENMVTLSPPPLVETVQEVVEGEKENIFSNEKFVQDTQGAKDALFWFDISNFFNTLEIEEYKEKYPDTIPNIREKLMGFQDDTRWLGTSEDFGTTWVGTFPSGGYNAELQDIAGYENAIMEEFEYSGDMGKEDESEDTTPSEEETAGSETSGEETASSETSGEGDDTIVNEDGSHTEVDMGEFIAGPSIAALDAVSVRSNLPTPSAPSIEGENGETGEPSEDTKTPSTVGGVLDPTTGEYNSPSEDEQLDYFDTVIMFSPAGLTNALTSSGLYATNVQTYTFRIKDGDMEITTGFASQDPKNELLGENYETAEEEYQKFLKQQPVE